MGVAVYISLAVYGCDFTIPSIQELLRQKKEQLERPIDELDMPNEEMVQHLKESVQLSGSTISG